MLVFEDGSFFYGIFQNMGHLFSNSFFAMISFSSENFLSISFLFFLLS